MLSSRIEGTITRLDQLFLFEAQPEEIHHQADAEEVRNYVLASEHGLTHLREGKPFTLQMLREVHSVLLRGVRGEEKHPGELRSRPVLLGRSFSFDEARFIPPCHTMLDPLLRDLIEFLREERNMPIVVQLALMHYQFETIHPFNDGNGRVGRLLITLMLCERECLPEPLLYLSAYFDQHQQQYYDCLLEVSRRAAWEEWIAFFARGVAEQARDATDRAGRLLDLWREYQRRVPDLTRSNSALRLVDELFASPYLTINRAMEITELAWKNAQKVVNHFEEAGILREVTGQKTNRVYCADEILRLLDAPLDEEPFPLSSTE